VADGLRRTPTGPGAGLDARPAAGPGPRAGALPERAPRSGARLEHGLEPGRGLIGHVAGPARGERRAGGLAGLLRAPATAPVATLVVAAAASAYLYRTDPHQSGHWLPRCPFNWMTGLLCPACGGTRLAYDLLHGDVLRAFHENALMFVLSPVMLWLFGRWVVEGLRGRRWQPVLAPRAQYALMVVAVLWTVVRNVR
jgi:hypothetical protein